MSIYRGTISGTGDFGTRENEITPDKLATVRNFICGYNLDYKNIGGIIKNQDHDFDCNISDTEKNVVHITGGLCFAYGYFGHGEPVDIMILPSELLSIPGLVLSSTNCKFSGKKFRLSDLKWIMLL